jgi:type I restriction enzyme S subunit
MKDENVEDKYEEGVVVKTLGEVCKFLPKSKRQASYGNSEGKYPFYTSSQSCTKYCDEYDYEEESLIIGTGGNANIKYSNKFSCSTDNFIIIINKEHLVKYIYYYLSLNIEILQKGFMGVGLQHISKEYINNIKIPIPSLEKQQTIVAYLDYIYEKANKTSLTKIEELKQLNEFCLNNQKLFGENSVKELGEVCKINPENMKSGQYTEINYIDIASVKGGQILELQKLTNDFPSRAKRIVKKGDILYSSVRPNLKGYLYISDNIQNCIASTGFANIRVKEPNTILSKYVYYIMTSDYISDDLINKAKGAQYPAVSFDDFETIKIPIPSLEKQKTIVAYLDYNCNLIKQLENEIENNKILAEQFIKGIVKNVGVDTDVDELEETEEIDVVSSASVASSSKSSSKASSTSSVVELKAQCKSLGIKKYSKLNKKELIELLSKHEC